MAVSNPTALPASVVNGQSAGGAIPWATGTTFALNQIVSNAGSFYLVTTAHTAGATFDTTKFQMLGIPDRLDSLVAPYPIAAIAGTANQPNVNYVYGVRVVIPRTGTLHDLAVCYATPSGNIRAGVYDTGDASAGNRSRLYDSGSVAEAGLNSWQVIGDPALAVTAGQQLDLVITNSVVGPGVMNISGSVANNVSGLPTSFFPCPGGASPKLAWWFNNGGYGALPATIAEASAIVSFYWPCIIARVA